MKVIKWYYVIGIVDFDFILIYFRFFFLVWINLRICIFLFIWNGCGRFKLFIWNGRIRLFFLIRNGCSRIFFLKRNFYFNVVRKSVLLKRNDSMRSGFFKWSMGSDVLYGLYCIDFGVEDLFFFILLFESYLFILNYVMFNM